MQNPLIHIYKQRNYHISSKEIGIKNVYVFNTVENILTRKCGNFVSCKWSAILHDQITNLEIFSTKFCDCVSLPTFIENIKSMLSQTLPGFEEPYHFKWEK